MTEYQLTPYLDSESESDEDLVLTPTPVPTRCDWGICDDIMAMIGIQVELEKKRRNIQSELYYSIVAPRPQSKITRDYWAKHGPGGTHEWKGR